MNDDSHSVCEFNFTLKTKTLSKWHSKNNQINSKLFGSIYMILTHNTTNQSFNIFKIDCLTTDSFLFWFFIAIMMIANKSHTRQYSNNKTYEFYLSVSKVLSKKKKKIELWMLTIQRLDPYWSWLHMAIVFWCMNLRFCSIALYFLFELYLNSRYTNKRVQCLCWRNF